MKLRLFYIAISGILILCVGALLAASFKNRHTQQSPREESLAPTGVFVNTPTPGTNPPVQYIPEKQRQLVELDQNRQTLSPNDQTVKQNLIVGVGGKSGVLSQDDTYKATYTVIDDSFEVEILTTDIAKAKENALSWFTSKGMSNDGICKLPLSFYLSGTIMIKLQNEHVSFNPLPDFCQ